MTNNWYQILNVLLVKKSMHMQALSKQLEMSSLTLKKSIQLLNEQLEGIAIIERVNANYQLTIFHADLFYDLMDGRLKKVSDFNSVGRRMAYLLKRLIESDDYLLIDDLAQEMEVSRGTANKDIRGVKEILANYGIAMMGVPNKGLKIDAPECALRLIYINEVMDYFSDDYVSSEVKNKIRKLANTYNLDFVTVHTLIKSVQFSLERIFDNHPIEEKIRSFSEIHEGGMVEELLVSIESTYEVTLSKFEREFLLFPLLTRSTLPESQEQIAKKVHEIYVIFEKMMTAIHQQFVVSLDEELLFEEMKYHLIYLFNRVLFNQDVVDFFLNEVQEEYPFSFELAKVAKRTFEEELGSTVKEAEMGYLAIYFEMALTMGVSEKKKSIVVVCNTGRGTTAMIHRQLRSVLGEDITIVAMTESAFDKADLTSYRAVFSTFPLRRKANIPIIQVTRLFDQQALLQELRGLQHSGLVTDNCLSIEYQRLNDRFDYQENVTAMIKKFTSEGYLDEGFLERWSQREALSSTLFSTGIGFPHTILRGADRLFLAIGTSSVETNQPVEKVNLIFLLGIPEVSSEATSAALIDVFDMIFSIGQSLENQKELAAITNVEDIRNYLRQRGDIR